MMRDNPARRAQTGFGLLERLLLAGLVAACAGALFAYGSAEKSVVPLLPKSLVAAAAAWWCWSALLLLGREAGPSGTPLDRPLAACFAAMILSAAFSLDRYSSALGHPYSYLYGIEPWTVCALLFYASTRLHAAARPEPLLRALAILTCALVAGGLSANAGIPPFAILGEGAVRGQFLAGHRAFAGACLLLLVPPALHLAFAPGRFDRILGACATALAWTGLLVSGSRAGALGGACACAAYLWGTGRWTVPAWGRRAGLAAAAASVIGLGGWLVLRAARGADAFRSSDSLRLEIWRTAARVFLSRPMLGTGPDALQPAFAAAKSAEYARLAALNHRSIRGEASAHNDLLRAAANLGLLGLGCYLWLLTALARWVWRAAREEPGGRTAVMAGSALLGLFFFAKFNPSARAAHALAAVLAGMIPLHAGHPPRRPQSRAACLAAWIFASCAFLLEGRIFAADRSLRKGVMLDGVGRQAEAEAALEAAARLNPWDSFVPLHVGKYHLVRALAGGLAEDRRAHFGRAVELAREAHARHPFDSRAAESLGLALMFDGLERGESRLLEEAEALLDRAQELDPYSRSALQNRLHLFSRRPDPARLPVLRAAVERQRPFWPDAPRL